jgi:hypothetical protein
MQSTGGALHPVDAILAPGAAVRYGEAAMPVPMRQQLEDAAIDCRSVTIPGGADRTEQIKRVAFEVAGQFRRTVAIEINGSDVVVSFFLSTA